MRIPLHETSKKRIEQKSAASACPTRKMGDECYLCLHKRAVPGSYHIRCVEPDREMIGNSHGIRMGWFSYPRLFDPLWKNVWCRNFVVAPKWGVVPDDRPGS